MKDPIRDGQINKPKQYFDNIFTEIHKIVWDDDISLVTTYATLSRVQKGLTAILEGIENDLKIADQKERK